MPTWKRRVRSQSKTLQECYEAAKQEIMDSCNLSIGEGEYYHAENLMAFIATRYAAAKGERFEGDAEMQYGLIRASLVSTLLALFYLQNTAGRPKKGFHEEEDPKLTEQFTQAAKSVLDMLEKSIPEWVNGPQSEHHLP